MNAGQRRTWSNWDLERFALGELPQEQQRAMSAALSDDAALVARLHAVQVSNEEILSRYPPPEQVRTIESRVRDATARHKLVPWWWLGGPLLASGLTVAWLVLVPYAPTQSALPRGCYVQGSEVICLKGAPTLWVYRQQGDSQLALRSDDEARSGDVLQLSYAAAGRTYGAIVSIDGRGTVTTHFPDTPGAAKLASEERTALPHAYELDDAPHFERFVLATSMAPFEVSDLVGAVQTMMRGDPNPESWAAAPLPLPAFLEQVSVTLRKGGR